MPTFGGPSPEEHLIERLAQDTGVRLVPSQPMVSRACPVCEHQVVVEAVGHDSLGIGMSTETAVALEEAWLVHIEGHPTEELLAVVVRLRREANEAAMHQAVQSFVPLREREGIPRGYAPSTNIMAAYPADMRERAEAEEAEIRLRQSREAQERYDPTKATPRYSADLPAGTVGIRR